MALETTEESTALLAQDSRGTAVKSTKQRQTFTVLYNKFRSSGLSKLDSAFNALYICQTNKLCSRTVKVNDVGDGFFAHPNGWFKEKEERVRRATKTRTLKALSSLAKLLSLFSKSVERIEVKRGFFCDSSVLTLDTFAKSAKRMAGILAVAVCSVLLVCSVYANSEKQTVVEFSVNGEPMGVVSSAKVVDEALDRVNARISSVTNKSFSFPYEVSYEIKNAIAPKCMDIDGVYSILNEYTEPYTDLGYGLYIDNDLVAVLSSREDIMNVLETVKDEHMKLTGEEEDIANRVDIKYQEYSPDDFINCDVLLSMFNTEEVEDTVAVAEHRALLSNPASTSVMTLEGLTPEFTGMLESTLNSNTENAIKLDFAVYYEETAREAVAYDTEYIRDDTYYEGQEIVEVSGRNGTADNTYKVEYINGVESGRQLLEQNIIRNPRTCVIKVGTRVLPETLSEEETNGRYMINPLPTGYVSSHFGWRILRGRSDFHEALDLVDSKGTAIYAAASGEVIYAGYSNSWGNYIRIRHADGIVTLYAHCSELLVSIGDIVSQGDEIALVGSTGDSTGAHLHFEVRVDDVRVDPEDYIYSLD